MKEIEEIAKRVMSPVIVAGEVIAVDAQKWTIDVRPLDESADIFDVKLRTKTDEQELSVIQVPVVGAQVAVGFEAGSKTNCYLLQASELDRLIVNVSGSRMEFTAEGDIIFNDGSNEGLVKLPELQQEIEKINTFLSTMRNVFSTFLPVPSDGGAALKTAMNTAIANLQLADLSDAGNDKIKH